MKYLVGLLPFISFNLVASELFPGENLISQFSPSHPEYNNYELYAKNDSSLKSSLWVSKSHGKSDTFKIDIVIGDGAADLRGLQRSLNKPGEEKCKEFNSTDASSTRVNGYPQLSWETSCDTGSQSIRVYHKAIAGKDSMYLVRKFWYEEVNQETVASWKSTIGKIVVCDTRRESHPCPEGYKLAEPKKAKTVGIEK